MTPILTAVLSMLAINACVAFAAYQIGKWRERWAVERYLSRMGSLFVLQVRRGVHRRMK